MNDRFPGRREDFRQAVRGATIEDNVIVYAGATIVGGPTVIGKDSIIYGSVFITKSVPEKSQVFLLPPPHQKIS